LIAFRIVVFLRGVCCVVVVVSSSSK